MANRSSSRPSAALAPWELRVLRAAYGCITPDRGPGARSIDGSGTLAPCDELVRGMPKIARVGLSALLFAVEWLAMLLVFVPGRLGTMAAWKRRRVVARLLSHPLYEIRIVARVLPALCATTYYAHPAVARSFGYDAAERLAFARREPNPEGRWSAPAGRAS